MAVSDSFFQRVFDTQAEEKDGHYLLTFQRVKLPMRTQEELGALCSLTDGVERSVEVTEDEVTVRLAPNSTFRPFTDLKKETRLEQLIFCSNLIHFFAAYPQSRLIPVCFPENLFFTPGFAPILLHYGVENSLPPLENTEEARLKQVKAVIASLLDPAESFDTYVTFDFAAKASSFVRRLLECQNYESLIKLIEKKRKNEVAIEMQSIRLPKKKNFIRRVCFIGSLVLLVPLLAVTLYAYVIQLPRADLFETAHENFLEGQYSNVVTTLGAIGYNSMPRGVEYELAVSYVKNQNLKAEQKTNILTDVTLQSNPLYYQYWIETGRGDMSGALNTARSLDDRMLIAYALLNEQSAIQSNLKMNGAQKQARLQQIDTQLKPYQDLIKKQQTAPASGSTGESVTTTDTSSSSSSSSSSDGTPKKKSDKSQKEGLDSSSGSSSNK